MAKPTSIPADRKKLQIWILSAWSTCADAVLIFPPRPKRGGQEMMVLKGSVVQSSHLDSCPRNAERIRKRLISLGKMKKTHDGMMLLEEDIVFGSPSQAANVVHGESKNGWLFWKLGHRTGASLSKAREQDREGHIKLLYYEKPEGVYEVRSEGW